MNVRHMETASSAPPRRRALKRRSLAEKRRIVEETLENGASVSIVARRHDVNANQVFGWRQLYRRGALGRPTTEAALIPVGVIGRDGIVSPIVPDVKRKRAGHASAASISEPYREPCRDVQPAEPATSRHHAALAKPPTMIEVELRSGSRIRIDAGVKGVALQQVLKLIRGLA